MVKNKYLFDKQVELADFCKEKTEAIEKKYPFWYVWSWTKAGKEWHYFMAMWARVIREAKDLL